jgi:hypothetical protein
MPFIEDLVHSIDARLQALSREIVSLEEAHSALIPNGRPQPQARRAPSEKPGGRPGERAEDD